MLNNLLKIFKSKIKSLDILYVIEDAKPVARIMILDKDLEIVDDFCARNGLFLEKADFKIGLIDEDKQFSNKGAAISKELPGWNILYISKERQKSKYAKEYEKNQDHIGLGMMLGYPECCCKFFAENVNEESKKNNDYIVPITKNTTNIYNPFYNNMLTIYFDHTLISHFPHSFDCQASIEIAKKHLEILKKQSESIAENYANFLKNIAIYTPDSVNILFGQYQDKNHFTIEKIVSTKKDDFYYILYNAKNIEIVDRHCIKVNKETIRKESMLVFSFN